MMEMYAYYEHNLVPLGKNDTAKDRKVALKFGDVERTRDYTEILNFKFDGDS